MIRYDYRSLELYQALFTVNVYADYGIYYTRVTDPLIASFLNSRRRVGHPPPLPSILKFPSVRSIYNRLPFSPNPFRTRIHPDAQGESPAHAAYPLSPTPTAPLKL